MQRMLITITDVFKALSDPTRLRLIRILASNMENRLCVVDLAKKLGISQPAASQHLKVLKGIGILTSKREGYHVYYYLNNDVLAGHKEKIDALFKMAFMKCPQDGECGKCPRRDECEGFQNSNGKNKLSR